MIDLKTTAKEAGFAQCDIFAPAPFPQYERRLKDGALHSLGQRLCYDPAHDFPWANAIIVLLYAYRPLPIESRISSYYIASNAAYHAANAMIERLRESEIRAERVDIPVRECAMAHGIGVPLKNGLTAWGEYGTRVAVQTLTAHLPEPVFYDRDERRLAASPCRECAACERACPAGAIDAEGFHFERCLRGNIDGETLPAWVMEKLPSLLGCEICQYACPQNAMIPIEEGPAPEFQLERLLNGDVKPALLRIGKNQNKGGKLLAHAAILAANMGRRELTDAIAPLKKDARPLVAHAANWSEQKLRSSRALPPVEKEGCLNSDSIVK